MKTRYTVLAPCFVLVGLALHAGCSSDDAPASAPFKDSGVDAPYILLPPNPGTTDASLADAKDAAPPCDMSRPFSSPKPVLGLPAASNEAGRLTPDELTIYFNTEGSNAAALGAEDIVMARRSDPTAPFGDPTWLRTVNSSARDTFAWINSEETDILFSSNRSNGGGWYIFEYKRTATSADFGAGKTISGTNLGGNVGYPWFWNGQELWMVTDVVGNGDIYHSTFYNGSFTPATAETNLNSTGTESAPVLSADGLTIFFGSTRAGGYGSDDIWTATRPTVNDAFVSSTIRNVSELNKDSTRSERPNWLSPDGCRIYLSSDRTGTLAIYVAERLR